MARKIVWSFEATADLGTIADYIGGDELQGEIRRPFRNKTGFGIINNFTHSSTYPKVFLFVNNKTWN